MVGQCLPNSHVLGRGAQGPGLVSLVEKAQAKVSDEEAAAVLESLLQEDEAAARAAMATHGQYDARLVWTASLALSRQRLTGGGKGCSMGTLTALS